jgi:hypothetical protein
MRCRPGIVTDAELGTIPDQRCIATRCTASGKREWNSSASHPRRQVGEFLLAAEDGLQLDEFTEVAVGDRVAVLMAPS